MTETYIIFSPNYLPHIGGVERYTQGLAKELVKRGKHVIIVASKVEMAPDYEVDEFGIEIHRIPSLYTCGNRMPLLLPNLVWPKIKKKLLEHTNLKVIVQTALYPMSLLGLSFAKKNRLPCIVVSHGSNYVCLGDGLVDRFEHVYEHWMMRKVKRMTDELYAVSGTSAQWFENFGCKAKGVLYNSVDHVAIQQTISSVESNIRVQYGIGEDTTAIAFVGRLIPEKGVKALADAFLRLIKEEDVALFVVGDGPLMSEINSIGCDKIFCLGYQPYEETIRLLSQCDCFCLPSDSEGFPTTVLEAILCRCYVITAPYGGAKEIISSAEYGCVMPDNSSGSIYNAVMSFMENRALCEKATDAAYLHFLNGFTWENTCRQVEAAFKSNAN